MFGIGGGEFIFIAIIALMLFGTDKLPEAARTFGKFMAQVKNASNDIKTEIQNSASENGITSAVNDLTSGFTQEIDKVKETLLETTTGAEKPLEELKKEVEEITGPVKRHY
jgi:sec-independent protein translocase protein TatA